MTCFLADTFHAQGKYDFSGRVDRRKGRLKRLAVSYIYCTVGWGFPFGTGSCIQLATEFLERMRRPFLPKDHLGFNGVWLPNADQGSERDSDSGEDADPARKEPDSDSGAPMAIAPPNEGGEGNPEQEQPAVETKSTEQVEPTLETKPVEQEQTASEQKVQLSDSPLSPQQRYLGRRCVLCPTRISEDRQSGQVQRGWIKASRVAFEME